MFTGLVDHSGVLVGVEKQPDAVMWIIQSDFMDLVLGESIAVNGICVTVMFIDNQKFYCDLSPETLNKTNADDLMVGAHVNLERAMKMNDRFGGHIVQGHVDTTAIIKDLTRHGDFLSITIDNISYDNMSYVIPKGSIAINGVSLTINEVSDNQFSIMLVPHTISQTTWQFAEKGQRVNIEFDYLVKATIHHLKRERHE